MTTSGSADFSVNRNEIIRGALRAIGAIDPGETPTAEEITDCAEALNMLVKQLMGPPNFYFKGLKPWARGRSSLTLSAKISYNLMPSGGDLAITAPVKILAATLKDTDGNETPLTFMTMEEYAAIPNKTDTGTPSKVFYERQLDKGVLYLDCIPDDITDKIDITYMKVLEDFDDLDDDPYFPQEMYRALKWNLAVEIAPEFVGAVPDHIAALAQQSLAVAQTFEPETSTDYFQPDLDR